MKQSIAALLLAVLVLLPACGAQPVPEAPCLSPDAGRPHGGLHRR